MKRIALFMSHWYATWVAYILIALPLIVAMVTAAALWKASCKFAQTFAGGFGNFLRELTYMVSAKGWAERRKELRAPIAKAGAA